MKRLSITSTCYCLLAIDATAETGVYESIISLEAPGEPDDRKVPIRKILKALVGAEWRDDDLFQVPLLLYSLLRLDKDGSILNENMDEKLASRIRQLLASVLQARPQRRNGQRQIYSDYITYLCVRVYAALQSSIEPPKANSPWLKDESVLSSEAELSMGGLPSNALPDGTAAQIPLALARCAEVSLNELCRQLAYRAANDSTSFDVIRLAYSLLTYLDSTDMMTGTAGRELVPGQGPAAGTKVGPVNRRLVGAALEAFFDEQRNDGLWDKGQPIYKSFRRHGRNVGNAFVFALDTVSALLEVLPPEDFRPYLGNLKQILSWIEGHELIEVISDYCDVDTGQCYGKPIRGWTSPHLSQDTGPQAWSTAQVLTCVSRMRSVVKQLMHNDVLREFRGQPLSIKGKRPEGWNRLLDSDLGDPSSPDKRSIKSVLEERVIDPFATSINNPSLGACYSAILFGPPGTAKVSRNG